MTAKALLALLTVAIALGGIWAFLLRQGDTPSAIDPPSSTSQLEDDIKAPDTGSPGTPRAKFTPEEPLAGREIAHVELDYDEVYPIRTFPQAYFKQVLDEPSQPARLEALLSESANDLVAVAVPISTPPASYLLVPKESLSQAPQTTSISPCKEVHLTITTPHQTSGPGDVGELEFGLISRAAQFYTGILDSDNLLSVPFFEARCVSAPSVESVEVFTSARISVRPGATTTVCLPPAEYGVWLDRPPFGVRMEPVAFEPVGGATLELAILYSDIITVSVRDVDGRIVEPKELRIGAKRLNEVEEYVNKFEQILRFEQGLNGELNAEIPGGISPDTPYSMIAIFDWGRIESAVYHGTPSRIEMQE